MGTRCLTVFLDGKDEEIAVLYRQFDGYPDGHGFELCDFLSGMRVVDGNIFNDKASNFRAFMDKVAESYNE